MNFECAQQTIYNTKRDIRFLKFIELYNNNFKDDPLLSFKVFKTTYTSTDNIYNQIKNSQFNFDLKKFLSNAKKNIDLKELMNDNEHEFYNSLPSKIKIYRGASKKEYDTKNCGISWSTQLEEAEKYIWFEPNNNKSEGGVLTNEINKSEIITVFSVFENSTDNKPKNEIIYITDE